jgi:predicted nucleic acid-binding protein
MNDEPFTLDTNILIYFVDHREPRKRALAQEIMRHAPACDCLLTHQALGEFFNAARKKLRIPAAEAGSFVRDWAAVFPSAGSSLSAVQSAVVAAEKGQLAYWDAMFLATAEEAGCTVALSEDMDDGHRLGNIVVRNPFAGDSLSPAAKRVLGL